MTRAQTNFFMRNILYYSIYVIMVLTTIVLFYAGPRLEAVIFPPVDMFEISQVIRVSDTQISIAGLMHKSRGECSPVEIVLTTGGPPGDPNTEILDVDFQDNVRNRPKGGQVWGPWIIEDSNLHGAIFTIFAVHRCHVFWNVHTILYRGPTSAIFGEEYDVLFREDL